MMKIIKNRMSFPVPTFLMVLLMATPCLGAQLAPAKSTILPQKVSADQLKSLQDDAVIDVNGKKVTKRQLMADMGAGLSRKTAEMKSKEEKSHAAFNAKRSAFLAEQQSKVDANNAKGKSAMTQAAAGEDQYDKIRAEAIQMNSKYASASPSEKARMDKRAGELMAQLKNLGY